MRRRARPRARRLGLVLAAVAVVALLPLGAVHPEHLAVVHLLVALAAIPVLALDDATLSRAGGAVRWARALLVLPLVMLVGLAPLPGGVLRALSPGVAAAREDPSWWTLALNAEAIPGEAGLALLALTFGLMVGIWGSVHSDSSRRVQRAVAWATLGLVVFSLGHVLTGARTVLGLFAPSSAPERFFAPLVNANHLGTLLLLALPLLAYGAWRSRTSIRTERVLLGGACLAALVGLAAVAAPGVLVSLAGVVVIAVWAERVSVRVRLAVTAGCGLGVGALGTLWPRYFESTWASASVENRLVQWSDTPALAVEHWLAGVGAGGYGQAYPAYTSIPDHRHFTHAHSDILEWVSETGLLGVAALGAAVLLLGWPGVRRSAGPSRALGYGLVAVALHAALDFPLQVPAVLLLAAGGLALRWSAFGRLVEVAAPVARRWVLALALAQIPLAAWQARDATAHRMVERIQAGDPTDGARAAAWLRRLAPWRPEVWLAEAWACEAMRSAECAVVNAREVRRRHPDDPDALRQAALVLVRSGERAEAISYLERAAVRNPSDYRTWALLARLDADPDPLHRAVQWAEALHHWPDDDAAAALREGWELLPVGLWWLEQLRDVSPRWSVALGQLLLHEQDPETAVLAFRQALELYGHRNPPLPDLALALARTGRAQEALDYLDDAGGHHPENLRVLIVRARVLETLGRHEDESETWIAVSRIAEDPQPYLVLAVRAAGRGDAEAGWRVAERLALTGKDSPKVHLEVARRFLEAGRPERCVQHLRERHLAEDGPGPAAELLSSCLERCPDCRSVP